MDRHGLLGRSQELFRIDTQPQVENARDVKAVRTLRDDYRMKVNVALDQSSVNVNGTEGVVKEVLTGAQGVTGAAGPIPRHKRQAMP
jgi:hypothetical protein